MSLLFLLISLLSSFLILLHHVSMAGPIAVEFIYPNFTASQLLYIDNGGVFLTSRNGYFQTSIYNPMNQQSSYYLSVLHKPTATLLWSANRAKPISNSGLVTLTVVGLTVSDSNGTVLWSTPNLSAPVAAARLLDTGNLQLLDKSNSSLWQSFEHPTDTIVSSQLLPAGSYLSSSVSNTNLAEGDYRLLVTTTDTRLTWLGEDYWRLSNDARSFKDNNLQVSVMVVNTTGLYLLASDNTIVFAVSLTQSAFRVVKLGSDGRLTIRSYTSVNSSSPLSGDFIAPINNCDLPYICHSLGLCKPSGNTSTCTCPPLFTMAENGSCVPGDGSTLASTLSCSNSYPARSVSYLSLTNAIGYFSTKFRSATTSGEGISNCHNLCSNNCTCTGYFYNNSSLSCYLLNDNPLGTLFSSSSASTKNAIGYVKTFAGSVPSSTPTSSSSSSKHTVAIILPSIAAALLLAVIMYILFGRRRKKGKKAIGKSESGIKNIHLGQHKSPSSFSRYTDNEEDSTDDVIIPGLPTRFTYEELEGITNNFENKIGAGGFGTVYKGELPDNSLIAVKKIEGVGVHGRKEFCTEIAVIGNIRHINLVRLRGFCAQGSKRLLVYEYMNRGSLDRPLFSHAGPVLEWGERVEIALGAARGLVYLHTGCEHKIVHCDVKPENILLADGGQVKISDFGLAKLMAPEQSALFTTMRGTRGYLAPEWLTNTAISDRADVYSFGMVLLELVRGRKNRSERSDNRATQQSDLSEDSSQGRIEYFPLLALEKHEQRRYIDLADPRLEGRVTDNEVGLLVRIALSCLHEEPALRPNMTTVVRMMEGTLEAWEPRIKSLNFLRMYGMGFSEPECQLGLSRNFNAGSGTGMSSSTTAVSWSPSHMSAQQLSGPR
ncbi:G-type lectin S-receptor-like serine/threonine-protein kinase [Carex littledalei]|uniref:Receptor-like serine/threonine-protein kinase n=1 Tax=Carex littledalei TaxID=544730 RepID=A0A833QV32_9POAL|nr:G-type lectin S-receptor-like serine/threonine-protein kinase [Carex littledalei]